MHVASASASIVLSVVQVPRVGRVFRVRFGASARASGGTFAAFAAFSSSSPLPQRPSSHKMTTPLYPNNCKQWLKADGALEKWKHKEAGQMSFVVFQLKAQTGMCPQHATFVVLVLFVRHMLTRHCPFNCFN